MPRIRTIKPDAFTSDSLSRVARGVRWTFAGLWTYADDEGRARDDARLIKAALYPIDDDMGVMDVEDDLTDLENIGAVCRYTVDGRAYLHMPGWGHQKINRPTDSHLPPCPHHDLGKPRESPQELVSEPSNKADGALTEPSLTCVDGKERKGKEQGSESAQERVSVFPEFWAAYPRKADRAKSEKAFDRAAKKHDPQMLVLAALTYAHQKRNTEPRFILHASTWLNGERWNDETDRPPTNTGPPPPPEDEMHPMWEVR